MISRTGLFTLIAISLIVLYGYIVSKTLRLPPEIAVETPIPGEKTSGPFFVSGTVSDSREFFINDRKVWVDRDGNFSELLTPSVGYTVIELFAQDAHARETYVTIPITVLPYANTEENTKENNE